MPILGLYTSTEVERIKKIAIENSERSCKVEMQKEINKLVDEHEEKISEVEEKYGKVYGDMLLEQVELENKLEIKESEVLTLRTMLVLETDKKIKRLEVIKKRTRKARTKKKIENRIIDYEMRKIAYKSK